MAFTLHPRLDADTLPVTDLDVCRVLMMNDARYPWLILVPRIDGARELHALAAAEQSVIWQEVARTTALLETITRAEKMNVAMLGNMVPQLHIHIIARYAADAAWPGPVWGVGAAEPYRAEDSTRWIERLRDGLLGKG